MNLVEVPGIPAVAWTPDTGSHEAGRKEGLRQAALYLRAEALRTLNFKRLSISERERRRDHLRRLALVIETLK